MTYTVDHPPPCLCAECEASREAYRKWVVDRAYEQYLDERGYVPNGVPDASSPGGVMWLTPKPKADPT